MPEHDDDFYTPSRIDEQVDALLQGYAAPARDQRMAGDLRAILEQENENAHSLQKVLHKLLAEPGAQSTGEIIPLSDRQQQGRSIVMQTSSHSRRTRKTQPMFRVWSTLAAILIIVVLVGSMLVILNAVRQPSTGSHGTPAATPTRVAQTPTPALKEGQIIYKSQNLVVPPPAPLAWSPDGQRVATTIKGTEIKSWDALTGKNVLTYPLSGDTEIKMIAWSPDGKSLAVAGTAHVSIFNAQSTELIRKLSPALALHTTTSSIPLSALLPQSGGNAIEDVAWSPDGRYLSASILSMLGSSGIFIWDTHTGTLIKSLTGSDYAMGSLRAIWQPHGHLLAILKMSGTTSMATPVTDLWDTTTWQRVKQYPNTDRLDWSPDGRQLALVNNHTKSVRIIDALSGQQAQQFTDPQASSIWNIHWSPDGSRLALDTVSKAADYPLVISLWNVANATQVYRSPFKGCFNSSWSPNSKYVACSQITRTKANDPTTSSVFIVIWVA